MRYCTQGRGRTGRVGHRREAGEGWWRGTTSGGARRATFAEGGELRELFLLFTKLGFVAFGGPAAHVAMMREEVVTRRGWMDDQEFLDLNGATNLIPGPNSTELAIHIGRERAGWRGLLVAGACFIAPATLIVLGFAAFYGLYGGTPAGRGLLYGVTPVVIAIVARALWGLLKTAVKGWLTGSVGAAALFLYLFAGVPEIPLLFGAALVVFAAENARRRWGGAASVAPFGLPLGLLAVQIPAAALGGLGSLFFSFLKIGSVLFGSGYVLLAFLRAEFVDTGVRPLAIRAMEEVGVDISGQESKTLARYLREPFYRVITVCDEANEACPFFPGAGERLHWSFPDPSKAEGTEEERLGVFRSVRDDIEERIRRELIGAATGEEDDGG